MDKSMYRLPLLALILVGVYALNNIVTLPETFDSQVAATVDSSTLDSSLNSLDSTIDDLTKSIDNITVATPSDLTISVDGKTAVNVGPIGYFKTKDATINVGFAKADSTAQFVLLAGIDTPFSFKGGKYPGTGGTCKQVIDTDCTLVVTFSPEGKKGEPASVKGQTKFENNLKMNATMQGNTISSNNLLLRGLAYVPAKSELAPPPQIETYLNTTKSRQLSVNFSYDFTVPEKVEIRDVKINVAPPFTIEKSECQNVQNTYNIGYVCDIFYNFKPTVAGSQKSTIVVSYNDGESSKKVSIPVSGKGVLAPVSNKNIDARKNLLVIYNSNSQESAEIKDYYLEHRPGISGANVLGVNVSNSEFISKTDLLEKIDKPLLQWLSQNQDKNITTIVLASGMPSRTYNGDDTRDLNWSVQDGIARAPALLGTCTRYVYGMQGITVDDFGSWFSKGLKVFDAVLDNGCLNPPEDSQMQGFYSRKNYPGTVALVTSIDMGSKDATKKYIDKLADVYTEMPRKSIVISAKGTSYGGDKYYFDDISNDGYSVSVGSDQREELLRVDSHAETKLTRQGDSHIVSAVDVTGYMTWGINGGYAKNYVKDKINFTGKSNWYLLQTVESFNGQLQQENPNQSNYKAWFSADAFGGTNYSNTPAAAVTHVEEPQLGGMNNEHYFECWDRNNLFIDCAWYSRQTPFFAAKGDPWITK